MLVYTVDVEVKHEAALLKKNIPHVTIAPDMSYRMVTQAPQGLSERPVVIGTGPCGLFAGLLLAQMGFRPIILERGKAVRERTQDTWGLWRKGKLDPESNVQFGEGGAGTFSDGKLYSQIKDPRHLGRKVIAELVKAGAPEEIVYVSKPHIGTFRLVGMVGRDAPQHGSVGRGDTLSEPRGGHRDQRRASVRRGAGERRSIATRHVVLAVGHSARRHL